MVDQERYHVAIQIEDMLANAPPLPTPECCIYKVPHRLRKLNPDAYTPKIVSIGPFHHRGNPRLLKMEDHKRTYSHKFIQRSEANLDDLVKRVKELEPKVRRCYSEKIGLGVEQFIKVIFVDCCFTLELLLRNPSIQDDTSIKLWLMEDIRLDLLLLENQLPFFIFEEIYNLAFASHLRNGTQQSFMQLASGWFSSFDLGDKVVALPPPIDTTITHFTDLYRYYRLISSNKLPERGKESLAHLYSATELKEAGVKLRVNKESKCFLDMKFSQHYLKIPQFMVADHTEMILRNMIAFEQCHCPTMPYFTDYVELLDCLINTEKDVDILVDNEIIVNWLGDSKAVARMFNGLAKNVEVGSSNTNYLSICQNLNAYYKDPWHRRMATLRRDYCNTPWRTVASIAAIALLMLTITQTVCSILQVP